MSSLLGRATFQECVVRVVSRTLHAVHPAFSFLQPHVKKVGVLGLMRIFAKFKVHEIVWSCGRDCYARLVPRIHKCGPALESCSSSLTP